MEYDPDRYMTVLHAVLLPLAVMTARYYQPVTYLLLQRKIHNRQDGPDAAKVRIIRSWSVLDDSCAWKGKRGASTDKTVGALGRRVLKSLIVMSERHRTKLKTCR